jgi:cobalt/nickel transport system ATP-binding protein
MVLNMPIKHEMNKEIIIPEFDGCVVQIKDLHFAYPDGHVALRGINLNICDGEKVALVGPNGAGKSTLILHMNGILNGNHGKLKIAGMALERDNLPEIRALVGMVFQNPDDQLFSPTVFDDVAFGPLHMGLGEEEIYQRVEAALAAVQMEDFGDRLSHHLSMGQKKRIAIATVLAMKPQILILDEPSSVLDPRSRRALINLLRELPITMLVSTHDLRMVQELFPRIVIMDEGEIVADGPTSELLENEDMLVAHGLERPY